MIKNLSESIININITENIIIRYKILSFYNLLLYLDIIILVLNN